MSTLAVLVSATVLVSSAHAAVAWDESVNGDLSNNGLAPTDVTLMPGWNTISGTTGRGANGVDRDYFTITVPQNWAFNSLVELAGTQAGGAVSFLGLEWGDQLTLPTNTTTAAGLLGWTHYGPTDTDIDLFPLMEMPDTGSSGFTAPLGAGDYSFWIQDFNTGPIAYSFALEIVPVPEPSTYALAGAACLGALALRRRFRRT